MSIAARLWSEEDLKKAKKDEWEATLLMNKGTFSSEEITAYNSLPFKKRIFECYWCVDEQFEERVTIYAPNLRMLRKFIDADYNQHPDEVIESMTKFKIIEL